MIHLKYEFHCSVCENSGEQTWGIRQGEEIPRTPNLPPGWRYVLGELVCGDHQISATLYVVGKHDSLRQCWRDGVRL